MDKNKIEFKVFAQYAINGVSIFKREHPIHKSQTVKVGADTMFYDWLAVIDGGWKLLLRPISDLIKDEGGPLLIETIVDDLEHHCDIYDVWVQSYIDNPSQTKLEQAPFEIYQALLANQFDLHNLIDIDNLTGHIATEIQIKKSNGV